MKTKTLEEFKAEQAAKKAGTPAPAPTTSAEPPTTPPPPSPPAPNAKKASEPPAPNAKKASEPPAPNAKKASEPPSPPPAKKVKTLDEKSDEQFGEWLKRPENKERREAEEAIASLPPNLRAAVDRPTQGVTPEHTAELRALQSVAAPSQRTGLAALSDPGDPENPGAGVKRMGPEAALVAGRLGTEVIATALAGDPTVPGAAKSVEENKEKVRETLNPAINVEYVKGTEARAAKDTWGTGDPIQAVVEKRKEQDLETLAPEARERAARLMQNASMGRRQKVNAFLDERAQEIEVREVQRLGGEEAITDGAARDKIRTEARQKALGELITMHKAGSWVGDVTPEDLAKDDDRSYASKLLSAFAPTSKLVDEKGLTERTESLPFWFVNDVLMSPIYGIQAGFDYAAGEDFDEALLRNVRERRTVLTARMDADEQLRSDLASSDPDRVVSALAQPDVLATIGIEFLSPDAISSVAGVGKLGANLSEAGARASRVATHAPEVARLVKGGEPVSTAVKKVDAALQTEKAARPAERIRKGATTAVELYEQTGDVEATASALEGRVSRARRWAAGISTPDGMALSKQLRDEYMAEIQKDADVKAYLHHNRMDHGKLDPAKLQRVPYGPEQVRRQAELTDELVYLAEQRKGVVEQMDADLKARVEAGEVLSEADLAGTKQQATRELDARIKLAETELGELQKLERAKAGEEKFEDARKAAGDAVMGRWWARVEGRTPEKVPEPRGSKPPEGLARQERLQRAQEKVLRQAFGGEVSPTLARKVAEATTPEELQAALRGAPQEVRDAVARRIGAADYESLVRTTKGTYAEIDVARTSAQARLDEARKRVLEAKDEYAAVVAAPAEHAAQAAARAEVVKAEKALRKAEAELASAGKVSVAGRAATRKLVQAAEEAEQEAAALRATQAPKSKRLEALEKRIETEQAILDNSKVSKDVRARKQEAINQLDEKANELADKDIEAHNKRITEAEKKATLARALADEASARQVRGEQEGNAAFAAASAARDEAAAAHQKALDAYAKVPEPRGPKPPEGLAGQERLQRAREKVLARTKEMSDAFDVAREIDALPKARANLRRALADSREEYRNLADALAGREPQVKAAQQAARAPAPKADGLAVELPDDFATFVQNVELARRDVRRLSRGAILQLAEGYYNTVKGLAIPYEDFAEQSLQEVWKRLARQFEGEMKDVGASLAHAVDVAREGKVEPNMTAFNAVAEYLPDFRDGLASGQMSKEWLGLAATGYLKTHVINTLPDKGKSLIDIVRGWAANPEASLLDLRKALVEESQRLAPTGRRPVQEGDIFLSQALGYGGAERRATREALLQGLVYGEADARSVNSTLLATFDPHTPTGGNPDAARGRLLADRLMHDPDMYRTEGYVNEPGQAVRQHAVRPMVPMLNPAKVTNPLEAAEHSYLASEKALSDLVGVMEEAEKALKGDLYVPRAVRDKILKHIDAAIATTQVQGLQTDVTLYRNFWKQSKVLGSWLSRPVQVFMDSIGEYMRAFREHGTRVAVKMAARSLPAQLLGLPPAAQVTWLVDKLQKGKTGDAAKWFDRWISNLAMRSPVDDIYARSPDSLWPGGPTGRQAYLEGRTYGLRENFGADQFTRTLAASADETPALAGAAKGLISGAGTGAVLGGPVGAVIGAGLGAAVFGRTKWGRGLINKNWLYLQQVKNVVDSRRRYALYVALLEEGMSAKDAAQAAVKVVGDFSREVGPAERGAFSVLFPFWSYRKFAMRSGVTGMLTQPYRSGLLFRGTQGAAGAASLAADVAFGDDEYGFHPGAMTLEPDPAYLQEIKDQIAQERGPDWIAENDGAWQEEARNRADLGWTDAEGVQHPPVPRARERYDRMVEELRKLPYDQALSLMRDGASTPELEDLHKEMVILQDYWAPHPFRNMLPGFAQDRAPVFLPKERSQANAAYFKSGTGRSEKSGDEVRYMLLPQDPLLEMTQTPVLAFASIANLADLGAPQGTALYDLVGSMFQDPFVAQAASEISFTPGGFQQRVTIPSDVAENLIAAGYDEALSIQRQDMPYHGQDPTQTGEKKFKAVYTVPASTMAALYFMKPFFAEPAAALDAATAKAALFEGEAAYTRGEPDTVDTLGVYGNFFTGFRPYTTSPDTTQRQMDRESEARLEKAATRRAEPLYTPETVERHRVLTRATEWLKTNDPTENIQRILAGSPNGQDIQVARGLLRQKGVPDEEIDAMEDSEVLARLRASE